MFDDDSVSYVSMHNGMTTGQLMNCRQPHRNCSLQMRIITLFRGRQERLNQRAAAWVVLADRAAALKVPEIPAKSRPMDLKALKILMKNYLADLEVQMVMEIPVWVIRCLVESTALYTIWLRLIMRIIVLPLWNGFLKKQNSVKQEYPF